MIIRNSSDFPDIVRSVNETSIEGNKTIVDDNDILITVQDLKVNYEDIIVLKNTGPVFKGDDGGPGPEGPVGPDLYHAWLNAGNQGSFDDFLNVIRQGLVNPDGSVTRTFTFTQNIPSASWNINHNMNTYPSITLVDTANEVFDADCKFIDKNNLQITIISPIAGKAYLN
jgi:hypothetical protein